MKLSKSEVNKSIEDILESGLLTAKKMEKNELSVAYLKLRKFSYTMIKAFKEELSQSQFDRSIADNNESILSATQNSLKSYKRKMNSDRSNDERYHVGYMSTIEFKKDDKFTVYDASEMLDSKSVGKINITE